MFEIKNQVPIRAANRNNSCGYTNLMRSATCLFNVNGRVENGIRTHFGYDGLTSDTKLVLNGRINVRYLEGCVP